MRVSNETERRILKPRAGVESLEPLAGGLAQVSTLSTSERQLLGQAEPWRGFRGARSEALREGAGRDISQKMLQW